MLCQAGGAPGFLDTVLNDVGKLLELDYDLVFLQGIGDHKLGAHESVKVARFRPRKSKHGSFIRWQQSASEL